MNELPRTVPTPQGLTVEGASPELLAELLEKYEREVVRLVPGSCDILGPGLTHDEIISRIEPLGYHPNGEVVAWWGWHNGFVRMGIRPPHPVPLSLDIAVADRASRVVRTAAPSDWLPDLWHPAWLMLDDQSRIAMRADGTLTPPPVRPHQPEMGDHTQDAEAPAQVISLCTPVTWWITAIREGWFRWNEELGMLWAYREEYPPEWWETRLI